MNRTYPHLVVRLHAVVYQREDIAIHQGPPDVHVGFRSSYVHHPQPFIADGGISQGCKDLLVAGVIEAVRRTGFRMCLVWGLNDCTYCEKDGRADNHKELPSGGLGSGGVGGRPLPIDIQFDRREKPQINHDIQSNDHD